MILIDLTSLLDSELQIGSAVARKRSEVPYDLTVVDKDEIAKRHYTNIPDALSFHAGSSSTRINTAQEQLSIRGSNAFQKGTIRFLVNGNAHNFDIFNITPWSTLPVVLQATERIEVARGPVPFYGRNAVSGAINVEMQKDAESTGASVELTYGSFSRSGLEGSFQTKIGKVSLVSAVSIRQVDNSFGFDDQHGDDKSAGTLLPEDQFNHYLTRKDAVNNYQGVNAYQGAYIDMGDDESITAYVGAGLAPNLVVRLPDRICKTWVEQNTVYGGANYKFDNDTLGTKHRLAVYGTSNSVDFVKNGTSDSKHFGETNPEYAAYSAMGYQTPSYDRRDINVELATTFTHGEKNTISFIPGVRGTQIDHTNFFGSSSLSDMDPTGAVNIDTSNPLFLEEQFVVQASQHLSEKLGLSADMRVDNAYKSGLNVGGLLSATYSHSKAVNFRVSSAFMERPPEVEEIDAGLKLYLGSSSKNGEYLDNQDLNSESAMIFDVGILGETERVSYSATAYFNQRNNVIEMNYLGVVSDPMGKSVPRYQFENAYDSNLVGANAEMQVSAGRFNIQSGLTLQKVVNVDSKLPANTNGRYGSDFLSPVQVFAGSTYTLGNFRIGVQGKFVASHTWSWPGWKSASDTAPAQEKAKDKDVNAYYPIDASLDYKHPGSGVDVFVRAKNLVNTQYNAWRFDKSDNYTGLEVFAGAKYTY